MEEGRHDWNMNEVTWDPNEMRAELRAERSPERSAGASSAQQVASTSCPTTTESAGEVPIVMDTFSGAGSSKRKLPMQCQVDGCNKDLASEKEYYQRYRICEEHLKLSSLLKDGVQQRFCQQCGRFNLLADFDGDKRSCRARLDLHNNRRRKRGESGSETYRSSARLDRRLGEQLHQRTSTRARSRRSARKARSDSSDEEEDILTEGSEVERPVIMGEGTSEIGSERRYATRQSTRKQHSQASTAEPDRAERRILLDQHLYPPNIAETLAALQRGPDTLQPASSSRYAMQDEPMWQSNAGLVQYNETRSWTADNMLRHLSDPVHSLRDSLQTSGSLSGSVLRRNAFLMNALSSPSHMPSRQASSSRQPSAMDIQGGEEHRGDRQEVFIQQDLPHLPYMPVSEAPYAPQSLYKCASDPSSNVDLDRPHISPAQLAGVHVAHGSAGGPPGGPPGEAAMFTYSSEPTAMASSSMVHPAGGCLSDSQFHDVAWPSPLGLHSSEAKREHLSFRQGPSKRFFETAEGLEQGEQSRRPKDLERLDSRSVGDQPFSISGFPWALPSPYLLSGPLGSLTQTSSGSLSRMPSHDEVFASMQASMQRELSAERQRMGRISLTQSMESMQQRMQTQVLGSEALQQQHSAYMGTPPLPTNALERIPEDSATQDVTLSPQDIYSGPAGASLLGDMFGIFSSGGGLSPSPSQDLAKALSQPQRQAPHQNAPVAFLGAGSSLSSLQALREASQGPWNPSAPMSGGTVTTGAQLGSLIGGQSMPEGSAWAAYLASPCSSVMSPMPSADKHNQWQSPGQLAGGMSECLTATSPGRSGSLARRDGPQQLHSHYRFDSASSDYNFPSASLGIATEFMPPAPITTGATPILAGPQIPPLGGMRRPLPPAEPEPGAPPGSVKAEMPPVCKEAARAAWPVISGALSKPGREALLRRSDSARGAEPAPLHTARVSTKLGNAGLGQLAGAGLREGVQRMLGGEGAAPGLQASVRPGCVHLVVDALVFKGIQMDSTEAIRAAADALVTSSSLWSHGQVLLQTASCAAMLFNGTLCSVWHGRELEKRVPDIPCAAPFAAAFPGSIQLRVPAAAPPPCGIGPVRLLLRSKGCFLAEQDLHRPRSSHRPQKVTVELNEGHGSGVAWIEAECNGFMSTALPMVLCDDLDIVEELRTLEAEVADSSRDWEDVSRLLADLGLILEYAEMLAGRVPAASSAALLDTQLCLQHVAALARMHLPFICGKGWSALASKVLCVAAVGCKSIGDLMQRLPVGMAAEAPTLLHAAVRSGSISMTTLLLDLDKRGYTWDLSAADAWGQTPLHLAAKIDDEGCMAGLLLRHSACFAAGVLWSTLKDASGQTPADIAYSTTKAHPGRVFLPLSPAERAAMSCTIIGKATKATDPSHSDSCSEDASETSSASSSEPSEIGHQDIGPGRSDSAYHPEVELALAALHGNPEDPDQVVITTPFSSFHLVEEAVEAASSSRSGSKTAVRRQASRAMRTADSTPGSCSTTRISTDSVAALEDSLILKSLSADTSTVLQDGQTLREPLRAALVRSLAAAARSAARSTSTLSPGTPEQGSGCPEPFAVLLSNQASSSSKPQQPAATVGPDAFSFTPAHLRPLPLSGPQTPKQAATEQCSQFGFGKKEAVWCGDAAAGISSRSSGSSNPADSSLMVPRGSQKSSMEELKQAQVALAAFPRHLSESQVTAAAGVRCRMRSLAQESPARALLGATAAAAGNAAGMVSPWDTACGNLQRLSVVVGDRHFRSASACPADYCTPDKIPLKSASSLSLPEDTSRSVLEQESACDAAAGVSDPSEDRPPCASADADEEDELVIYRRRSQRRRQTPSTEHDPAEESARASSAERELAADRHVIADGINLLHLKDGTFHALRNGTATAGPSRLSLGSVPGLMGTKRAGDPALFPAGLSWRPWLLPAAILASCTLVLPSATILCMVAASLVFVMTWTPSSPASVPGEAQVSSREVDESERQATHAGWRRYFLCFHSSQLEKDFLEFYAGARWPVDVLFSCLFAALAAFHLASSACVLTSHHAAVPWVLHLLCASLPAVVALHSPHWYVRQREAIMIATRLGCQVCMLCCGLTAVSAQRGIGLTDSWPAAIAGDVMASVLQMVHLPIGFQIRMFLHLPLTLLALRLRLRLRVRQPGSWAHVALICALTLAPAHLVALLERRARRCFLAARLAKAPGPAARTSGQAAGTCRGACLQTGAINSPQMKVIAG